MRIVVSIFFLFILFNSKAQDNFGDVLFWTAQDWECDFLTIKVYTIDSILIADGKLKEKHTDINLPECGSDKVLNFASLPVDDYFFVSDCSREACYVCKGEGSYWQATVQAKNEKTNGSKNKGAIGGVYKTCHVCEGAGAAFQILWIDTFRVTENKCRTILLK